MMNITVEQIGHILRRVRNSIRLEHLPDNGPIGRTGEGNPRQVILHPESLLQGDAQSMLPRSPGQQQRPIDIEKQKFFVRHGQILTSSTLESERLSEA